MVNRYFRMKAGGRSDEEISKEAVDLSIAARNYVVAKSQESVPKYIAPPAERGPDVSDMQHSTQDPGALPDFTAPPAEQGSDVRDVQNSTQDPIGGESVVRRRRRRRLRMWMETKGGWPQKSPRRGRA